MSLDPVLSQGQTIVSQDANPSASKEQVTVVEPIGSPQKTGLLDTINQEMFGDDPSDMIEPETPSAEPVQKENKELAEALSTTSEDASSEDFDPLAGDPTEQATSEWKNRYEESQKQIGVLAEKIGILTEAMNKQQAPKDLPPAHEIFANATPEQILKNVELPEGITPAGAKWMATLVKLALDHQMKTVSPVLSDFQEMKRTNEVINKVASKYSDFQQYAPKIQQIVAKHYPQGVPSADRESILERAYQGLKKHEKASSQATSQNAQRKAAVKQAIGSAPKSTPPAPKKKSTTLIDTINEGMW